MFSLEKLSTDLAELFADGASRVHILADFDGTLTKEYIDGKKTDAIISVLREDPQYLSPSYRDAAHELYKIYSPFEKDLTLPLEIRKTKMTEWWSAHFDLLIASGLHRAHLVKLSQTALIEWRDGAREFLSIAATAHIPVIILSASGVGDVIPLFCAAQNATYPNMHFLVNQFVWNETSGAAIDIKHPIIHALNKDETVVQDIPAIADKLHERDCILLIGNSLGDLGMAAGCDARKKITIAFLDTEEADRAESFAAAYDHVIIGDDYTQLNELLKIILGNK